MKNKGLLKNVFGLALIMVFSLFISSCGEDAKPIPTLTVVINSIDGFVVDIAAEATDATTWSWEYGDGNVSVTEGGHFYTYTERGDFTITCTVTGEGGTATKTVDVHIATKEELLTGNIWVLSNAGTANGMGFRITSDLLIDFPAVDILATLNTLRSGTETYDFLAEYEDEYTFGSDGAYSVDYKNGNVLASWVYSREGIEAGYCDNVGMYALKIPILSNATWTLHENENLTLNTVYDADRNNEDGVEETVNFTGIDYITYTNGGFLGIKDYTSTVIIQSIKADELVATVFFHGYENGGLGIEEPSYFFILTFKPKG